MFWGVLFRFFRWEVFDNCLLQLPTPQRHTAHCRSLQSCHALIANQCYLFKNKTQKGDMNSMMPKFITYLKIDSWRFRTEKRHFTRFCLISALELMWLKELLSLPWEQLDWVLRVTIPQRYSKRLIELSMELLIVKVVHINVDQEKVINWGPLRKKNYIFFFKLQSSEFLVVYN